MQLEEIYLQNETVNPCLQEASSAADTKLCVISIRKLSTIVTKLPTFLSACRIHAFPSVPESRSLLFSSAVCFSIKSHLELLGLKAAIGFPCHQLWLWPGDSSNNLVGNSWGQELSSTSAGRSSEVVLQHVALQRCSKCKL